MDRTTIAARIQALLSKTVERGCTEAEALAAAEKAQELLHLYQLERSNLDLEAEGVIEFRFDRARMNALKFPWTAIGELGRGIARFTDCRGWTEDLGKSAFCYAGLRTDIEFATWLTESLVQFAINAYDVYSLECITFDEPRPNRVEFFQGLTSRLKQRMYDEVDKRNARNTAAGCRDLIVVKRPIVDEYLRAAGHQFSKGRTFVAAGGSATAGARFADKAGFGRPVRSATARIGKA